MQFLSARAKTKTPELQDISGLPALLFTWPLLKFTSIRTSMLLDLQASKKSQKNSHNPHVLPKAKKTNTGISWEHPIAAPLKAC